MKRSKFFCENCHQEVKPSAKICPHCGRFFTAVRCPSCAYVGESRDFIQGCPKCGYAGGAPGQDQGFETLDLGEQNRSRPPKPRTPAWVYPLAAGIIIVVFVGLVIIYLRL